MLASMTPCVYLTITLARRFSVVPSVTNDIKSLPYILVKLFLCDIPAILGQLHEGRDHADVSLQNIFHLPVWLYLIVVVIKSYE